jgi:hypothetical protein
MEIWRIMHVSVILVGMATPTRSIDRAARLDGIVEYARA